MQTVKVCINIEGSMWGFSEEGLSLVAKTLEVYLFGTFPGLTVLAMVCLTVHPELLCLLFAGVFVCLA